MAGWKKIQTWTAPELDEEQQKRLETKLCTACGREYEGFFVRCSFDQRNLVDVPPPKGPLNKRFECIRKIGNGDLFDVYEGSEINTKERVAVKVLKREVECDQRSMKAFEQELIIASALKHENIASILAFGALPEQYTLRPYLITEFIDGLSLASALQQWGPCDAKTSSILMEKICDGFDHAHQLGAVHGDFKPSNVFLFASDKHPGAKIVDFAVSRRIFGKETSRYGASASQSMSSALYCAPELAKGAQANQSSDIYAVGCVFYHLLSGKPPFEGNSPFEIAYSHEHDQAQPLPESAGSEDLRQSIMRCLEKDPSQRLKRCWT